MDLIKCPRCGEEYSPSYRKCPFCEEGDHSRRIKYSSSGKGGRAGKTGRRVSDGKQTHSARGAMAAVLAVVLLLLSWSLFGDRLVEKLGSDKANDSALTDDRNTPANDDAAADPGGADADPVEPSGEGADPNGDAPAVPDENGGDAPDPNAQTPGGSTTTPGTTTPDTTAPTVDASALSIKTNVGTTLPKDANGNFDCTIGLSESIRLSISGTDAAVTWSAADTSVLTVSADGGLSPLKTGTTTVTASAGGASLLITVRVVK